ncbi:hypothetical protein DO62_5659 [Burkholderia pseudomallei]|nr:hypothetical protein DO62_5659 [Burkholderia pseudomallei]
MIQSTVYLKSANKAANFHLFVKFWIVAALFVVQFYTHREFRHFTSFLLAVNNTERSHVAIARKWLCL